MLVAQLPDAAPPVGGAPIRDILIAIAMTTAFCAPVAWTFLREQAGKKTAIGTFGNWVAAKDGMPRWAGLPTYMVIVSVLTAGFGVWWDVAIHMQNGRDEGPLSNPSHYPIFFGILLFFSAGLVSMALAKGTALPKRTIEIAPGMRAPLGSLIITGSGVIALLGFPLDDLWHRLFGPDVTEWGPTHVMMIGGAVTCVLGLTLLHAEAAQIGARGTQGFLGKLRGTILIALWIVPFAFLMEFDLGVPQFPAATQFIISGFLTVWVFTAARAYFGKGGALLAWGVYIGAHLFLMGSTALVDGVLLAKFLLFLPAAIIVEFVALAVDPRKGVRFGVISGLLVGTVGMYLEWMWTQEFMPLPQPLPSSALPFMLAVATVAGVGGGLLSAWMIDKMDIVAGRSTTGAPAAENSSGFLPRYGTALAGFGIFVALMAAFAGPTEQPNLKGTVTFSDVGYTDGRSAEECNGTDKCLATVTVNVTPLDTADDAAWFYALAWQGNTTPGDTNIPRDPAADAPGIMRVRMLPTGTPGEFRSEYPLPLYGAWKTLLRLHQAPTMMMALPLYAPDDPAILEPKGRQIVTTQGETVSFVTEHSFLQREAKDTVPAWMWNVAYAVVQVLWLSLIAFYGWCYAQAAHGNNPKRGKRPSTGAPRQERLETADV